MTKIPKRQSEFVEGRGYGIEDWNDVSDNPEFSADDLKKAKPFAEAFPELAENIRRGRGRPRVDSPKQAVTLRLSPDTLAKFKAGGRDWRARMSEILDKANV
ncbi:BrnA antitoxin family protein [Arvimicrobium flavum]|uniref:BrnA antitoxin family protein n=1 Tax=Arvimicrobium flavum TaxID=3393320 RepID=UPI00237B0FE8|nr:BrnA antitoxin family protein [Mesorhizobium shangrilense]